MAVGASRRPLMLMIGTAILVGRLSGEVAWMAEASRCPSRLPDGALRVTVRLLEPADEGGGRIAVRPLVGRCAGSVVARWPRGSAAPSGAEAQVEARWVPRRGVGGRPAGTLLVNRVGEVALRPGLQDRLRTYIFETSHRLYGGRAGMIDALILGRRGGIEPELQDQFAWSGLVHLLSISGFHVGLISAWVLLLGRVCGPEPPARVHARRRGECRLRRFPRLARAGDPSRRARRGDRPLPRPPATRAGHPAPLRNLSHRPPRGSLGHPRSRRLALGRRTVGRGHVQPVERSGARSALRVAHVQLVGGRHPGYRADHGGRARHGGARGDRAELRGHSARGGGGARGDRQSRVRTTGRRHRGSTRGGCRGHASPAGGRRGRRRGRSGRPPARWSQAVSWRPYPGCWCFSPASG